MGTVEVRARSSIPPNKKLSALDLSPDPRVLHSIPWCYTLLGVPVAVQLPSCGSEERWTSLLSYNRGTCKEEGPVEALA